MENQFTNSTTKFQNVGTYINFIYKSINKNKLEYSLINVDTNIYCSAFHDEKEYENSSQTTK